MKFYYLLTMSILCFYGIGCKSLSKTTNNKDSITTRFEVFINEVRVSGIIVKFSNLEGTTDEKGIVGFPIKKSLINGEGKVHFSYPPYEIDKFMTLPIKARNPIYLTSSIGPRKIIEGEVEEQIDYIKDIKSKLDFAEKYMDKIEEQILKHIEKYPHSAMGDLQEVWRSRRSELNLLKSQVANLTSNYEKVIEEMDEGKIVNTGKHNIRLLEFQKTADFFFSKLGDTENATTGLTQAEPDEEFNTEFFFGFGDWKIEAFTNQQKAKLNSYVDKINQLKNLWYPNHTFEELELKIHAIGYTDGVPVGDSLNDEISPYCEGKLQWNDPNICLSWLRAETLANYVIEQTLQFSPEIFLKGEGSKLAGGSVEKNQEIRKCLISFSLLPIDILKTDIVN